MASKDYYHILGVGRDATPEDLKKAFRELAHKHHPDKGGSAEKFKEINEAYQVLGNPDKKKQYDQFGQTFDQAGGGGFGGMNGANFDFSNMGDLGEMFGDMFGFGGGRRQQGSGARGQARGRDIEMNVKISFREAAFGTETNVDLYKPVSCRHCSGAGFEPGSKMTSCQTCRGQGRVRSVQRTILGSFESVVTCSSCGGAGNVPEKTCRECSGAGVKRESKRITVKIPAGIDHGETIRLTGEGEAAGRGGRNGDLYLHVKIEADARFEREGYDVSSTIEISFADAALGVTKEVETLNGPTDLKIPAGIQSGTEIRLKGKGITKLGTSARGDHFVSVIIHTPEKLSRKSRDIFEQLREEGF
jgi:molecular chaperone DnaJ